MDNEKRDEILLEIHRKIGEIDVKLTSDFRVLHGNGHPGLIEKHESLEKRVLTLENKAESDRKHYGVIAVTIGFIIDTAITLWSLMKS